MFCPMLRFTVYFYGRVQGVGFRWRARDIASMFAVAGTVQNTDDGRVLLEIEGAQDELQRYVDAIRQVMRDNIARHTISRSPATGEFGPPRHGSVRIVR
jgi:acylphosphatase